MMGKAGGFVDAFLPDPQAVWMKYQAIQQRSGQTAQEKVVRDLINRTALQTGAVGAVTSFGGLVTLLILLPVDMAVSTRMEAELVYLLAFAHGVSPDDPDLPMMVYWVLAGETAASAGRITAQAALEYLATTKGSDLAISGGKTIGMNMAVSAGGQASKMFGKLGKKAGHKAAKSATRKAARKASAKAIGKVIPKAISKIFPVVGAAIGFVVNFAATQSIGNLAARWFREMPQFYAEIERATPELEGRIAQMTGDPNMAGGATDGQQMGNLQAGQPPSWPQQSAPPPPPPPSSPPPGGSAYE